MKTPVEKAIYLAIPIFALLADQATKIAMQSHFRAGGGEIAVIPGFIELTESFNTGGAFGLLPEMPAFFLVVRAAFAIGAFFFLATARLAPAAMIGLGLAAGGAMGNLADRFRMGPVYDFIDCHIGAHYWPTFNAADAFIVIGAGLIAFGIMKGQASDYRPQASGKDEGRKTN